MDETGEKPLSSHPDADTTIIFVTGEGAEANLLNTLSQLIENWTVFLTAIPLLITLEFPANEMVKFLVGFTNKGTQDFTVKSLEASFRYPQEFQFYVRNVRWICSDCYTQDDWLQHFRR